MERILVFHPGALGDVILTLPFLFSLHKRRRSIVLYTQSWLTGLSSVFNFIDEWRSLETRGIHKLFSENFSPKDMQWIQNYSKVIVFFKSGSIIEKNLAKLNVSFVCGAFLPNSTFNNHITEHLQKIFHTQPDYHFIPERKPVSSSPVIIHPGSGNRLKNWDIKNFLKLAQELNNNGERIIFVLGPAELKYHELLKNTEYEIFSGTLPDLFKLVHGSKLFIGNDSGIAHLSAVSGTQTVVIFGPSNERVWCPVGNHVFIIKKGIQPPCSPCISRNKIIKCNYNASCMPEYEAVSCAVWKVLGEINESK